MKSISRADIDQFPKEFRRNFINSLPGFKSAILCGTVSPEGVTNLSLLSSVIHVGANPPLMGMLMRPDVVQRDTVDNIKRTGCYTLNVVGQSIVKQAHQASARYPQEISEFDETGLTPIYSAQFPAPYVGESKLQIGLRFKEFHRITTNATLLIVGEIIEIHLNEKAILEDGFIDHEILESVAVSGLDSYHRTQRIGRLPYAKA